MTPVAEGSDKNLDDLTVAELRGRASDLEITGRSSMNKEELRQAVDDAQQQTAMMKSNGTAESSSAETAESTNSDTESTGIDSDSPAEDRPWRDSGSSEDGEENASGITAPSIGPNTTIEHRPPDERLDMEQISNIDAMGLDKRRQVGGKRYGASPAKQVAVYGGALAVIAALFLGGIALTNELDTAPPEGEGPIAPWADAAQRSPGPIDFPCELSTDPGCRTSNAP